MSRTLTRGSHLFSSVVAWGAALALAAGCGSGGKTAATMTATSSVTPAEGGTVTLPDNSAHLDIPAGALTSATMITISTTDATPPAGITPASPILKFEPDGLVFTKPVTVTFTFTNATRPIVYWSNATGGYDPIAGLVSGSTISAQVMHFSSGFVADAPATAGAAACGQGVSCTAGATCGYGASPSGSSSGNSSSGTVAMADGGSTSHASSDPGSPSKTSPLCASSGGSASTDPAAKDGGAPSTMTNADPGAGSSAPASVDASAGGGTTCMSTTPTSSSASMCCMCGADGTFQCGACSSSVDGTGTHNPSGGDGGSIGPNAGTCAAGTACTPGQNCGGGDSAGNKICCTCGADGTFQCGATCSGQPAFDGGPAPTGDMCVPGGACVAGSGHCGGASATSCFTCDCGADGTYACSPCDGGATPPPPSDGGGGPVGDTCAEGATCTSGSQCKGPSPTGQCLACMCGAAGTLQCSPCAGGSDGGAPPPPTDGGSNTPPPATCDPGLACPLGYQCGNKDPDGGCMMCTCGADGHLACGACSNQPPQDGGAAPNIPPQACVPGGGCPQAGVGCSNGLPSGGGCQKCGCSADLQLMCVAC